ncbi:retron Se72 family effector protein [Pectobacterium brasiliense]|uniref:retron Se72 family effector protein n=1 Tax=Pectobacterium brasiliense TaxID=180957 RepID=UPI002A804F67|nr:retron Se72 family effector protein [Pectobacterium brasiliense]MDY4347970.1 retron Se72 family effector protein [Pectobacterium brasiliense]
MNSEDVFYGIVKTFDSFKGFGFISREKGKDVFFFYNEIIDDEKTLYPGDAVMFTLIKQPKGPRAYNVKKIK